MNSYQDQLNCESIKHFYGIDVSPEELIYFEEISDFSWADSLIIYRKDNILYSIEDETVIAVSEDEAMEKMLDFEETKRMYP